MSNYDEPVNQPDRRFCDGKVLKCRLNRIQTVRDSSTTNTYCGTVHEFKLYTDCIY